jgi:phage terminase large subunit-like protein
MISIPNGWEPLFEYRAAGVDLAISKNDRADYTAIVSGTVYRNRGQYHIYLDRHPTNKRLSFRETIDFLMNFKKVYPDTHLFIESTSYQQSLTQQLLHEGIDAHDIQIGNISKLERLATVGYWIRRGQIHFPKEGSTDLVNQIVNFGAENHDDLVDAFTLLTLQVMEFAKTKSKPSSINNRCNKVRIISSLYNNSALKNLEALGFGSKDFNLKTLENDPYGYND